MIEFGNDQATFNKAMYFQKKQMEYFNLYEQERQIKQRLKITPYDRYVNSEYHILRKNMEKKVRTRQLANKKYIHEMWKSEGSK